MNLQKYAYLGVTLLCVYGSVVAQDGRIALLKLPDLTGWKEKIFTTATQYTLVSDQGRPALRAFSNNSASALIRDVNVDLRKTPYLNWSWRVSSPLTGLDEASKAGDDYSARVYIIIKPGAWFWQSYAISYVWSGSMPQGRSWPNAFTGRSYMMAIESGRARAGVWRIEKRNVLDDLYKLHGISATHINAVAIMTDTDNSHDSTTAYYGDIYFSRD